MITAFEPAVAAEASKIVKETCRSCRGSGLSQDLDSQGNRTNRSYLCPRCNGTGRVWRLMA